MVNKKPAVLLLIILPTLLLISIGGIITYHEYLENTQGNGFVQSLQNPKPQILFISLLFPLMFMSLVIGNFILYSVPPLRRIVLKSKPNNSFIKTQLKLSTIISAFFFTFLIAHFAIVK